LVGAATGFSPRARLQYCSRDADLVTIGWRVDAARARYRVDGGFDLSFLLDDDDSEVSIASGATV
jgi:hypothetical protein